MTNNPHADESIRTASDKIDLDELLEGVKPYTGGDEFGIPGFFETDEEQAAFIARYRAEREKELA